MLDKLLLNNQILANKTAVQQVKVSLVNKQVQKLRKLKKLSEKHPENKKFQHKIARTIDILGCIKKTKRNEILRQALLYEKTPMGVITNGLSTPEEIAQALYISHKTIEKVVNHLKTILNLADSDQSWREAVAEPSKRKRKQQRTEKKQKFRQERKTRNELNKKRSVWLEENLPEEVGALVESINDKNDINKKPNPAKNSSKPQRSKSVTKSIKSESKAKKETLVPRQTESSDESQSMFSDKDDEEDEEENPGLHAVDEFFVTQSGDHYLSTAVVDRIQKETPNDGMVRKDRRATQNGRRSAPDRHRRKENGFNRDRNASEIRNDFRRKNTKSIFNPRSSTKNQRANGLRPSWAAKQTGIRPFNASKVVSNQNSDSKNHLEKKSVSNISQIKSGEEKLHPSWEAKQKLKTTITGFQGKKIVFDKE